MSSVATEEPEPRYLYVRALVDDDGSLRWEYQLPGRPAVSMAHDENVGEWKEREIVDLTRDMLSMQPDEEVKVIYL